MSYSKRKSTKKWSCVLVGQSTAMHVAPPAISPLRLGSLTNGLDIDDRLGLDIRLPKEVGGEDMVVALWFKNLSTPDQSPQLSSSSSAKAVEQLFDPNDLSIDPSPFQLNPVPADVALPDSSSDASFDTVGYDLNNQLFSLQLGSTEYHFTREQLDLYEDLLHASGDDFRHLFPEDRLYLLSLNRIECLSPPPSKACSNMAPSTSNTAGNTNTIIIDDKNYSIAKLQGQEDYHVWRICMEDMYQDAEVWDIVSGASTLK
ncbi:hypothetical protein OPQ81_003948 [Rhizoctonia solani]|nr:hypothetical protein OPQ81_003948 [Rhizoctonia solani]